MSEEDIQTTNPAELTTAAMPQKTRIVRYGVLINWAHISRANATEIRTKIR